MGYQIFDLLVADLKHFPNLKELLLTKVPLSSESLEKELLCASPYLEVFSFWYSLGHLQKFPRHIFNCSEALNITVISLLGHNIAFLPAYAFQSTAHSVKYHMLRDIGLETIHRDAFSEVLALTSIDMERNRITSPMHFMIPPSPSLKVFGSNYYTNKSIDLSLLKLYKKDHLSVLLLSWTSTSSLKGKFCSNKSQSKLKVLAMEDNPLMPLFAPLFDDCVSLKYLQLKNNVLQYLDTALFERNVSLEVLDLSPE